MFVFRKIWCALFSCHLRLKIRPFAFLPTLISFNKTIANASTAWKMSKYGVISGPYFPAVGVNTDQKQLCIWTLSTQWRYGSSKTDTLTWSMSGHATAEGFCVCTCVIVLKSKSLKYSFLLLFKVLKFQILER